IGDMCAIYSPYAVTDNVITGGWMDDRVGCFVLLEVMENIKSVPNTVYFLFSSQEEVGLRGARTASYNIEPDAGITVDVTDSSDLPEGDILGSSAMGKGAAIKIIDKSVIVQKKLVNYLVGLAEKNGILYQRDVSRIGSTDAHAIQLNKSGTFAGGISIPTRYVHSAGEMCSLEDIQACIDLALKFCENELPF
ncbi:MAG: M20/M25/M40 family metallo-hydrolase, partial [Spirochaetes bacterium]|nr:M20/M25/M40 family metallo-hydrolase [Spirochaetota bacterium]